MNKQAIKSALSALPASDFLEKSKNLLATLGYQSERTLELSGTVHDFLEEFPALNPNTKTEQEFQNNIESVKLVFQFTSDEIDDDPQMTLLESNAFDKGNISSFLFCAVELKDNTYSRTQYAAFTREINKRLIAPTVILFRAGNRLTVAFADRRPDKTNEDRDVLGQVTLIKDIRLNDPHRAHLDILSELSFEACVKWIDDNKKPKNFDGLLSAWLAKLDTETLNKQFYRKLFAWYEWAIEAATFPTDENRVLKPEEHVIRLITRLLFIWFIKEKGLVAEALFNKSRIQDLLAEDDFDSGDAYYRAVLQNLFFATLNTEIDERKFSKENYSGNRNFSRYRYKKQMRDPDKLLELFANTPFINGGLFDCLDTFDGPKDGGYRIDCFSDVDYKKLSIPNNLFFHESRGLIPLLQHYKFTVEENTPIEQEVALDPELLGRVFENLLAAYNPETGATVRKQTGSYYTPRPIVDYMVAAALVATLSPKCHPTDGDTELWDERLHYLLDYAQAFDDANEWFDDPETDAIVRAISELKVLDPAVGSGAFPMGMLHKLTLALRRLDPDNTRWEKLQKERAVQRTEAAYDTQDDRTRREELLEIDETFKRYRDSDFGRKLYLIQNSIFGVDIQSVACQIAKLRFFISLAIEQEREQGTENFGIKPLPNLETRFIAANTLIGLKGERTLTSQKAQDLERELSSNRERHFHATTRQQKRTCKQKDTELRTELATELKSIGMPADDAEKIASWDPYDQNATADWFDSEWMFGITDGFDVVIGNPPYINVENLPIETKDYLFNNYKACQRRTDIYIAFLEKSIAILSANGIMGFILPYAFAMQKYGEKMRQILIENHTIREIVDASSYRIFENATVYNIVLTVSNRKVQDHTKIRLHHSNADFDERGGEEFLIDQYAFAKLKDSRFETNIRVFDSLKIKEKIWQRAIRFDQICLVAYGARLNHKSKKLGKNHYISQSAISGNKRFCEGKSIERYSFSQEGYLNYTPNEHYNPMFPELFENQKLMFINVVKDRLRFAYDDKGFYNSHTVVNCVRLDLLSGVSHISARRAFRVADSNFAKKYDYKFLLGILNSNFTNWYFLNFLSEGLHFYPNDAKELPIPDVSPGQQIPIIELVDQILDAKRADPDADTSDLENEIDTLVYELYKLTEDEIAIVEGV
ncbi:MAG: Eco57I restriction-modification methylase domain-containing protein [Candidatus Poribacteria bacterium]|nr:Eco57I restriction-modification methylase domain-containing protein [Candidatus Poribacteria bacterium]